MIRDTGPYTTRNTSKGALIDETGRIVGALEADLSLGEARRRALDGGLLAQRARDTRKRIWRLVHYRLLSHRTSWVLADLKQTHGRGIYSEEFVSLLYLHYALRDKLTFDFVTQVLWDQWRRGERSVSSEDLLSLLDRASAEQPQVSRWSTSSRQKLGTGILAALRDFGVLSGKVRKTVSRPPLPAGTAGHLCRLLMQEGLRGNGVLNAVDWRLFLRTPDEVGEMFVLLGQKGLIHYERAGGTIVQTPPDGWEAADGR